MLEPCWQWAECAGLFGGAGVGKTVMITELINNIGASITWISGPGVESGRVKGNDLGECRNPKSSI
ncbi:MAG: hypothetical protein KF793_01940 [Nitrospira sp.]|nr:hypothetical protein [Nitrospira sp.]